jgi:Ca2+-binding EF-hand superfamily protein
MRRRLGMIGTFAIGMTALAPTSSAADDQTRVGIHPLQSIHDLESSAKLLFKLADTNNDGQLSQKEVGDAGLLLVGGFFFRADTNGDGVLTPEEAEYAQETLFAQQPLLKLILQKAKPANTSQPDQNQTAPTTSDPATIVKNLLANPERMIGNLLDSNHDHKIESTELRQAVKSGVQILFSLADTNQDGQLTPYELTAVVGAVAKSTVQTAFLAADTDHNRELSLDEYDKALAEPAHALFRVIDADSNKQISLAELERAEKIFAGQIARLRVSEPSISPAHQTQPGSSVSTPRTQGVPASGASAAAPPRSP